MFARLLALFIIVPLVELFVIIQIGSHIGYLSTILILIVVSIAGAALAKQQGYRAFAAIQEEMRHGRIPANPIIEGVLVLAAALLLLTPGYVTDFAGLLLLVPPVRHIVRNYVRGRLARAIEQPRLRMWQAPGPGGFGGYYDSQGRPAGGTRAYDSRGRPAEQRRKELEGE